MKQILAAIGERTAAYDRLPFYAFLRDDSIEPRRRISFAPALAHFVMSFSDLYAHVLRETPARDRFQELVNAHTEEDGGHWKWFLSDLARLDADASRPLSESLRYVWQRDLVANRLLTYEMCRLGYRASSIEKLVLVHCIEATGKVSLKAVAPVATALAKGGTKGLVYFGAHHFETESDHTLEDHGVHDWVADVRIDDVMRERLLAIVHAAFDAFVAFADELHRYALAHPDPASR
jgi:hypothetical protein